MINLVPTWWVASIVATLAITVIEYFNRAGGFSSFREALWITGPVILIAQWALFYTFRDAPSLMIAWWVFTIGNSVLRLGNVHFFVGEPVNWRILVGVSFMLLGGYFVKTGS